MTWEHWKRERIKDALDLRYGKSLPKSARDTSEKFPVVGSAGRMSATSSPLVEGPVVVVGRKGNIGQVQLELSGCWPIDTTYYSAIPDGLDCRFLYWQLTYIDLSRFNSSTTTPSLRKSDFGDQYISIPSLVEQRRIVSILEEHLSHLDAADVTLEKNGHRLESLRSKLVHDAVTGVATGDRTAKELADVGVADGDLPPLPDGWEWSRLGSVADVVGGVTKDAKKQADPSYVEVPYLRVANVQRGYLKLDEVTAIRVPPVKAEKLRLHAGDVLLNEGGDRDKLARGWVWEGQIEDCIHQNHVFRARIAEPRLTPEFLSFTANSIGGPWAERNGKQSVNLASISLKMIKNMPVIVPSPGAAQCAVDELQAHLAGISRLQEGIVAAQRRSAALRRSLLDAAFTGRLTERSASETVAVAGA